MVQLKDNLEEISVFLLPTAKAQNGQDLSPNTQLSGCIREFVGNIEKERSKISLLLAPVVGPEAFALRRPPWAGIPDRGLSSARGIYCSA